MSDLTGLISIARKGGFVIIGQDNLLNYNKKLFLILLDVTAGKSLKREMNFLSKDREIPLFVIENLADVSKIENCKVIGIKNKIFSDKIIDILQQL